jgi:hypothetical protein
VPALAVDHAGDGHPATHRCHCPPGHHDCTCPVCRSAIRQARRADVAALPECHRARALEELAREEAEDARRWAGALPSLRSGCHEPDDPVPPPAGRDAFVLPVRDGLCTRLLATPVPASAGTPLSRTREPEVPPPRRA